MSRTISDAYLRRILAILVPSLSIALLLIATTAVADSITYQILPNPQTDLNHGGNTADLLGTITISNSAGSPLGTFDSSDDSTLSVSSNLTMTSSGPDTVPDITQGGTASLASILGAGSVQFTSAGLFLFPTTTFEISNLPSPDDSGVLGDWNPANGGEYLGEADLITFNGITTSFQTFSAGSYFDDGAWEIAAAVPEPSTLALLGSALVGLAALRVRRRRAWLAADCHCAGG